MIVTLRSMAGAVSLPFSVLTRETHPHAAGRQLDQISISGCFACASRMAFHRRFYVGVLFMRSRDIQGRVVEVIRFSGVQVAPDQS